MAAIEIWNEANPKQRFGIVKCNFDQKEKPHRLLLDVGDAVVILKETTYWFYGFKQRKKNERGIFPKSYIHLCDYKIENGDFCIRRTEIVEEITKVLLEWGTILKQYFLINHPDFQSIRSKMNSLNFNRTLLISGNLPADEMRKIKLIASSDIDTGNNLLGLDMVVRDENGDILDTNSICTTELYEHHMNTVNRIIKASRPQTHISSSKLYNKYSHNILLQVNAFVCKFQEDSDFIFTLYDGETHKAISENYIVKWSRTGIARDIEQFDNNRVLFTDLSKNDINISKLYLVCYVIRIGSMDMKEIDSKRISITSSVLTSSSKKNSQLSISSSNSFNASEYAMRRPFGVAYRDLTPALSKPDDFKGNFDMPFILCEKDSLDSALRKLIANKDIGKIESRMAVTVEILQGDVKQIKEDFPRLLHTNVPIARKMGFPEVILPGDVRNDLYLTICSGEFSRSAKTSEKNVEVCVSVCNEHGETIFGVISIGAGLGEIDEYKSVVYYHDDKPKWLETFKIHIPIEDFKQCHLKFLFKHRSSNEQKDRAEKPFGMSYIKLMQNNGTTIMQGQHILAVYKIDHKKLDKTNFLNTYMDLPATVAELQGTKPSVTGLVLLPKDQLIIDVNLCSTKLTQSVSLLGLLNWSAHKDMLDKSLRALSNVPGEEVVKFLQDILDALFNILVENDDPVRYDQLVFMSIIYLIETVSDLKYQHFLTVLDVYINESFSATLAYVKLIDVLKKNIREAIEPQEKLENHFETDERVEVKRLYKTTRYLHYIIKFIIRSRILYIAINGNADSNEFSNKLHELLEMFIQMIACPTDLLKSEGALLKNLHIIATDLLQIFDPVRLSIIIVNILKQFPPRRLTQSKMGCIKDFVDTKLFYLPECRAILLPVFCNHIKDRLESKEEGDYKSDIWQQEKNLSKAAKVLGQLKSQLHTRETTAKQKVSECINILNIILKLLHRKDIGAIYNDVRDIMLILLRTVIKTSHALDRENQLVGNLVAIMLGILQDMESSHYDIFVKHLNNRFELQDFVIEILLVFEELVSPHQKLVFPRDWLNMIMHQNMVILQSLRHLSVVIIDNFFDPFEKQVWSNFFQCSIAFLIQSPLQLNDFNDNKRQAIFIKYRDIRKEAAQEIRKMWFQLGEHKPKFVPQLVEPILEMSMIPEIELRKATIPIFFDMMQCEYYSSKHIHDSYGDTKRNNTHYKANFNDFETEMIEKLDILIGAGRGDIEFKDLFQQIMLEMCLAHNILKVEGTKFVNMVSKLMDRLLEYRCIIQDESKENRMACTFSLLQFYSEVNRKEMYIRYVYKLCDLHMEFENYTEAAFTLTLHTELLLWKDTELSPLLRSHRLHQCRTHRELKEALYYEIIDYFDKGKMWECAIDMCKVLIELYENEIYDYIKLAVLLKKMALFYEKILKELRHTSEYFRVCFYGLGFPRLLQNKAYIFRGKEYERLSEFSSRLLIQHPQSELMHTLEVPGEDITQGAGQYIQINKVEPIMDDEFAKFNDKNISNEIVKYFANNNVQKFKFSRPYRNINNVSDPDDVRNLWVERTILTSQFSLPGILRWFPVIDVQVFKISPLELAVETMKNTNKDIRDLIITYRNDDTLPLNPLSMKINGIVDPAVMGGLSKYEDAFLTAEYLQAHPTASDLLEELKDLIASQVPLLEIAIALHRQKAPESLKLFHERMESCFADMQSNIELKYGKKVCELKFERESVVMRRNGGYLLPGIFDINNRLSETSMGSSDSGLSKSTLSTRPQTSSIKSTFTSFNFNSRPSLGYTSSTKGKIKEKTPTKRKSIKKLDRETLSLPVANSQWYTSPLSTITSTPERELQSCTTVFASNISLASKSMDCKILTEELTPKRPLRSEKEKEKRLSRPASIATPTASITGVSVADTQSLSEAESSNRNSVNTTDSNSEEDLQPPPLPAKTRDSTDFSNLNNTLNWNATKINKNILSINKQSDATTLFPSTSTNSIINTSYEYVDTKNFIVNNISDALLNINYNDRRKPPTPPPKPSRNSKNIP